MTQFIDLVESGKKEEQEFDVHRVVRALLALQERCREQGKLACEGVWRLHRKEVRTLTEQQGFRPPGGWRGLCSLAVGTGVLRADEDCFVVGSYDGSQWDAQEVRTRLLESFTRWLIPPATAAGLFLAMNVHPLWGLRLARKLHVDAPMIDGPVEGWRDEALLPEQDLAELRKGVFAALSTVLSGLRRLRSDERYGEEALVGFVGEAIEFGRGQIEAGGEGLEVLIEDVGHSEKAAARSTEFAAREFFEGVLVPAGVMRRYDDGTFAMDVDVLEKVRVGALGRDAQRSWLQTFLASCPDALVA